MIAEPLPAPSQWALDVAEHLWPWIVALVVVGWAARTLRIRQLHRRMTRHAHLVHINPPPEVDPAGASAFWAAMTGILYARLRRRLRDGRAHIGLEYRWSGRKLSLCLWLPATVPTGPVQAAVRGAWPGATCTVTDADPPLPLDAIDAGGALTPALPPWYALKTDHDNDPLRVLLATASGLHAAESICVQVLARPATARQTRRLRAGVEGLQTGRTPRWAFDPAAWLLIVLDVVGELVGPTRRQAAPAPRRPQLDRRTALDKLTEPQWEVALRYGVTHTNPRRVDPDNLRPRLATLAHGVASAFSFWTSRNHPRRMRLRRPATVLAGRSLRSGFLLSTTELATLATLPQDLAVPGLDRARATPRPVPTAVPTGGRDTKVLGRAELGGHAVALPVADARQHVHVLGSTGSGKSTLLLNMILDDIHARRGVVVIDPKGDLVVDLINRIPPQHAKRLVLIDPDQPTGVTLNPLSGGDPDLAVDNVVSIFGRIFAKHWGPRMDDVLRVACLTLLRKNDARLTLIPQLLQDRPFRRTYTADLDDPEGLQGFWDWYETAPLPLRSQVIAPLLSRLRNVLLRPFPRATFGSPRSSFDMRRVLDGGILLARLPKGQVGEDTARLMGSFVVASAWQAATGRARLPETDRRDAFAYIDEAHNFLNLPGSVDDMLAEARGYHLGLVLSHQNLAQLPRETQLAISANARQKVFFNCAPEDARQLARHTQPELEEHDLSHLDAFQAACRLVIGNRETAAFTLRTNPPKAVVGDADEVRRVSAGSVPSP
ncbi:type IV secretory system conjugative DNA transfer family protein [Cryptosporangium arvum]|uniref:Putative ATPase n=1 Tax=Cryptosporangium arvum DSM 44712 TaxID=927661 RepID=A0A010ZXQ8_9ACTN|nr:type IV secretion system DNA-binding domain-containing protein [Cryptosporangium arvum]EXG82007.1 putative ATPase [Cryptosporangium arvum DSM 44712]